MISLDRLWGCKRLVPISGKSYRVPFAVSLPSELVEPISLWIRESGVPYAVQRVKKLKVWALHILAGRKDFCSPWIASKVYKHCRIPKLRLFEYLVDHLHDLRQVRMILAVLNSYKQVITGEPSLSSVMEAPKPRDTAKYVTKLRQYVDLPRVPESVLEYTDAVKSKTKFCDDFGYTSPGPIGRLDRDIPAQIALLWSDMETQPACIGKVVAIPDKGKWRNILIGHWGIQLKTKRLADWLRQWLWAQPEIASGDQRRFSDFIVESLKKDRYMLSIDLSEATDRLDREVQIEILTSMGVPRKWLSFFNLPFYYQAEMFGKGKGLKKGTYSAGQPMGLYLSFPMFELLHWIVLKFVTAISDVADFRICGDDLVIACDESEAENLYQRYVTLMERFGGVISEDKTLKSRRAAEGVGALFLKGYPKEIRIPSGKLSPLEALMPGTWLHQALLRQDPLARSIHSAWLELSLEKRYTYDQRANANQELVNLDLSDWHIESLRSLVAPDNTPLVYPVWDDTHYRFWRNTPQLDSKGVPYRWISSGQYRESLITHKIITLYKQEKQS